MGSIRRQGHRISFYKRILEDIISIQPESDDENFLKFCLKNDSLSNSQFLQDLWVMFMLSSKRNGYFVEFGAGDGIEHSNTYILEKEFGWAGLLIEPVPTVYKELRKNRSSVCFEGVIAVSDSRSANLVVTDYTQFSSIEGFHLGDMHAAHRKSAEKNIISVRAYELNELLLLNPPPNNVVDYLSIDVEGAEAKILPRIDFEQWRFNVVTCEHNFREEDMKFIMNFFLKLGYRHFSTNKFSGGEYWFFREDILKHSSL